MERQAVNDVDEDPSPGTSTSQTDNREAQLSLSSLTMRESGSTEISTTSSEASGMELSPGLGTATSENWTDDCDAKTSETKSSETKSFETKENEKMPLGHQLRQITWRNKLIHVVTQNENGPCPLIAIVNVLLLRGTITLPVSQSITADQLIQYVADVILNNYPKHLDAARMLDYERNINDAITVLPRLLTGLDVNVIFTGVKKFEYTPECIIFDLLNISLYHGWLVDPQDRAAVTAIGSLGYNQLVDMIVVNKSADKTELVTTALIAEQFLEGTATQLTYHGLCELNQMLNPNELAVLFRNNHFSTIYKRRAPVNAESVSGPSVVGEPLPDGLYQLVTDQGFMVEPRVVWEAMVNIEGDGLFVDSHFLVAPYKSSSNFVLDPPEITKENQIDQDYLLALSLNEEMKGAKGEPNWEESKGDDQPNKNNSPVPTPQEVMEVDESSEAAEEMEPPASCHGSKSSIPSSSKSPVHQPPPAQNPAPSAPPPTQTLTKKTVCSVQ